MYGGLNDKVDTVTIFCIYRSHTSDVIVAEQTVALSSMVIYRVASLLPPTRPSLVSLHKETQLGSNKVGRKFCATFCERCAKRDSRCKSFRNRHVL